jgi:hypothetical protein
MALGSTRADLVWEWHHRLWIDEVKTGAADNALHADQVASLLLAGSRQWADAFAGVRLLSLSRPSTTRTYRSWH